MEAAPLLRVGVLLAVLAFAGTWWLQEHYLNAAMVQHLSSARGGWKMTLHAEFAVWPRDLADRVEDAEKADYTNGHRL